MMPLSGIAASLLLATSLLAGHLDRRVDAEENAGRRLSLPEQGPPSLPADPTEAGAAPPSSTQAPATDSGSSRLPRVEFPLERSGEAATRTPPERLAVPPADASRKAPMSATMRQISMLDLRDPFARRDPSMARSRTGLVTRVLPDLKDPFQHAGRARAGAFEHLQLPGDIRDPFRSGSSPKPHSGATHCTPTTKDGVPIQKPGGSKPEPKTGGGKTPACHDVITTPDLRDPFPG